MKKSCLILLAFSTCMTGALLTSCDRGQLQDAVSVIPQDMRIKVFPMLQREVTDYGEWFGYLRGEMDTDIHPRVTGFLASQEYRDGQYVQEGDVLFRIDDSLFRARLEQAEANLAAAKAAVAAATAGREQAELDLSRYEKMGGKVVSEKDISDARQKVKSARAGEAAAQAAVEQGQAAVENARIQLDYTVVKAPYSGVMSTATVSQGDLVSPATKLAGISAVDTVRVQFAINGARMINAFRKYGDLSRPDGRVQATPFTLLLEDGTVYPIPGHFSALESKVESNGVINMEGRFANPTHLLRSGMSVRVRIPRQSHRTVLVPPAALQSVLRKKFILVMDGKGIPHMLPVRVTGEYTVPVEEANGYSSEQKMMAIEGEGTPLEEFCRTLGYESVESAPVVSDADNGVLAVKVSSANSRLAEGTPRTAIPTEAFSFKPVPNPALVAAASEKKIPESLIRSAVPAAQVKVMPMVLKSVQVPGEWFGTLRGVEETDIRPQVSGFLIEQQTEDGRMVKKGDVLFRIDPAPYEAARNEASANRDMARAEVAQKEADLEMARKNYAMYERLAQTPGAISDKTVTDAATSVKLAEAALSKAQASVAQCEAALSLAEINLDYTCIRAPFDGRVGIHKPSLGALVSPQDPEPLVTLSSVNPIRVDFQISGKDALAGLSHFAKVKAEGQEGDAADELDILLEDGSLYPAKGRVTNADNALDKTTGTLAVNALVENADGGLRSGMPVRVRADIFGAQESILVPARAPLNNKGKDYLVLLTKDDLPCMLPITKLSLVTVPVAEDGGKEVEQPMQMVDVDRETVGALMLMKSGAPTLEALALQAAQVPDWDALILKQTGAADFRTLAEQRAGNSLPDDAPATLGAEDWKTYVLRKGGFADTRAMALAEGGYRDELDMVAKLQHFGSLMEMVLKQMGYDTPEQARVVVEGSLMAAQLFQMNQAPQANGGLKKLIPMPFHYTKPKTVVESVTAE